MEHPHLVIDGIHKRYDGAEVLQHVSLSIREGEFFFLLGPSGCGKTTLLRILAGLLEPDSGRIILDGVDITRTRPEHRDLHTVFQHYALFPHMTVYDNVAFGLRMRKEAEATVREKVMDALRQVALDGLDGRKPGQLSGGQSQRVALARALVNEPSALLLDEPLGALDVKLRQQMQIELKQLQRRSNTTFVCVTHDQEEALSLGDRIAVMDQGVVQQVGTPDEVYHHPANRFVCEFLGASNILTIGGREFGLRPEDVRIGEEPGGETMDLTDVLFNGHYMALHCRRDDGGRFLIHAAQRPEGTRFQVHWDDADLMPL
jgi:ABC-type Fe3+/spermidine/putrescine transport system ATPase subunit